MYDLIRFRSAWFTAAAHSRLSVQFVKISKAKYWEWKYHFLNPAKRIPSFASKKPRAKQNVFTFSRIITIVQIIDVFIHAILLKRKIFTPILFSPVLPSLSVDEFKSGQNCFLPFLSFNTSMFEWIKKCGKTICKCRKSKIIWGDNNPVYNMGQ